MTALHDAHEKLRRERDGLPPTVRDALDVVLNARCGGCQHSDDGEDREYHWCAHHAAWMSDEEGCLAWEQREGTA